MISSLGLVSSGPKKPAAGGTVSSSMLTGANSVAPSGTASLISKMLSPVTQPAPGTPVPGTVGVYQGGPASLPGSPASAVATGASSAPAAAAGGTVTNTAAPNPVSNDVIDILKRRADGNMGVPGQLDREIQKVRERAATGIANEQQMSRIRRGVAGTGIDAIDANKRAAGERASIDSITTDLTLGRERDRDNLYGTIAGLGLSQGAQQLSATAQANSQRNSDRALAMEEQRLADARASDAWQREATMAAAARSARIQDFQTLLTLLS